MKVERMKEQVGVGWTVRALLLMVLTGHLPAAGQEPPVPVPVTGATVAVDLSDGGALRGELIHATDESLLLLGEFGLRSVDFGEVSGIRAQRHGMHTGKALAWVAVGALVTGLGMTVACSQVENTDCGQVFLGTTLAWTLIGVPLSFGMGSSAWERGPADVGWLRPRARFPQGAPAEFLDRQRRTGSGR